MDAPYLYIVKFWVHPDSRKAVMDWLDKGHMAEVVAQRGFGSCGGSISKRRPTTAGART